MTRIRTGPPHDALSVKLPTATQGVAERRTAAAPTAAPSSALPHLPPCTGAVPRRDAAAAAAPPPPVARRVPVPAAPSSGVPFFPPATVLVRPDTASGSYVDARGREIIRPRSPEHYTLVQTETGRQFRMGGVVGVGSFGKARLIVDPDGNYFVAKVFTGGLRRGTMSRLGVRHYVGPESLRSEVAGLRSVGVEPMLFSYVGKHSTKHRSVVVTPLMAGTAGELAGDVRSMPRETRQACALWLARDCDEYIRWNIHQAGHIHNDLKPENLLVGRDGRVQLTDAGNIDITGHTHLQYTRSYRAPEVGIEPHGVAADIFALAITLGHMFAGRLPWLARTDAQMAERRDLAREVAGFPDVDPKTIYGAWMWAIHDVAGLSFTTHLARVLSAPTPGARLDRMEELRDFLAREAPATPPPELRECTERRYTLAIERCAPTQFDAVPPVR